MPYRSLDDAELITGLAALTASSSLPNLPRSRVVPSGPARERARPVSLEADQDLGWLSLDDFGRASSLAALRHLPLDEVEIDSGFVHGLDRNRADAAVVRGLSSSPTGSTSRSSARAWVARSGTSSASSAAITRRGFYIAEPTSAEKLTHWLEHSWPAVAELVS